MLQCFDVKTRYGYAMIPLKVVQRWAPQGRCYQCPIPSERCFSKELCKPPGHLRLLIYESKNQKVQLKNSFLRFTSVHFIFSQLSFIFTFIVNQWSFIHEVISIIFFLRLFILQLIHWYFHLMVHSSVSPFVHWFIYYMVHLNSFHLIPSCLIDSLILWFIYSFLHQFFYSLYHALFIPCFIHSLFYCSIH